MFSVANSLQLHVFRLFSADASDCTLIPKPLNRAGWRNNATALSEWTSPESS
jgi:hypothetical protein